MKDTSVESVKISAMRQDLVRVLGANKGLNAVIKKEVGDTMANFYGLWWWTV